MRDKRIIKKAVWETTDGMVHNDEPTALKHQQFLDLRDFFARICDLDYDDSVSVARTLLTQFKIEKFPEKMRG